MRGVLSPLLTGLSGSAADVTAAKWKGRQYFRSKVIPANPQTANQMAQRHRMSYSVIAWQGLMTSIRKAAIKTAANRAASAEAVLGYNLFTRGMIAGLKNDTAFPGLPDPAWTAPYGFNPAPVIDLTLGTPAAAALPVTWTDPEVAGIAYAAVSVNMLDGSVIVHSDFALTGDAEAYAFEGLDAETPYNLSIIPYRAADQRCGPSADVRGVTTAE